MLWFDQVIPLGCYQAELRQAIVRMKHFGEQPLAVAIGRLLADRLAAVRALTPPIFVAPVPIHWVRRFSRRTSGPEIMSEAVAGRLGIPLATELLLCRRKTKKQSMLSPLQRRVNVQGAFRVSPGYAMKGLHVVLIDDVVTTGATANEAAKTLRRAGAAQITVTVVARAVDMA